MKTIFVIFLVFPIFKTESVSRLYGDENRLKVPKDFVSTFLSFETFLELLSYEELSEKCSQNVNFVRKNIFSGLTDGYWALKSNYFNVL